MGKKNIVEKLKSAKIPALANNWNLRNLKKISIKNKRSKT